MSELLLPGVQSVPEGQRTPLTASHRRHPVVLTGLEPNHTATLGSNLLLYTNHKIFTFEMYHFQVATIIFIQAIECI